jgi:RNA polymerase sigma-70 factor (ECF subfamily)
VGASRVYPQSSEPADADLLALLRAGDASAFEALVREHTPRLLAVAQRFLVNEADAQDAVQDAFVCAFRGLAGFDGQCKLGTWLHAIAVRACLMKLRTRRRRPETPIEELLPQFHADGHRVQPGPAWGESIDQVIQRQESRELVRRCIDELPDSYRTVLLLRDIEELSTDETAKLLGTNTGVVKTRLHRARQALRTLLDPYFGTPSTAGREGDAA